MRPSSRLILSFIVCHFFPCRLRTYDTPRYPAPIPCILLLMHAKARRHRRNSPRPHESLGNCFPYRGGASCLCWPRTQQACRSACITPFASLCILSTQPHSPGVFVFCSQFFRFCRTRKGIRCVCSLSGLLTVSVSFTCCRPSVVGRQAHYRLETFVCASRLWACTDV